jgi:hypothetical protein
MRSTIRFTLAVALLLPIGVVSAGPVGAAGGTSCKTSIGKATIAPGLSLTAHAQTITAISTLSGCSGGGVTGGSAKATLKLPTTDCTGLAKGGAKETLTETITWNTKKTTTFTGATISGTAAKVLQATLTAKVTAGLFKGSKASTTIAYSVNKGSCSKTSAITGLAIKGLTPLVIK